MRSLAALAAAAATAAAVGVTGATPGDLDALVGLTATAGAHGSALAVIPALRAASAHTHLTVRGAVIVCAAAWVGRRRGGGRGAGGRGFLAAAAREGQGASDEG